MGRTEGWIDGWTNRWTRGGVNGYFSPPSLFHKLKYVNKQCVTNLYTGYRVVSDFLIDLSEHFRFQICEFYDAYPFGKRKKYSFAKKVIQPRESIFFQSKKIQLYALKHEKY